MQQHSFKAKDHIKALNNLRLQYNGTFTDKEFKDSLKKSNIPSNSLFFSELRKYGVINKIHKNIYAFVNPKKPIYYLALQEIYTSYYKRVNEYRETYRKNKLYKETVTNKKIKEAVDFLKSKGFEIYAPVRTLFSKV